MLSVVCIVTLYLSFSPGLILSVIDLVRAPAAASPSLGRTPAVMDAMEASGRGSATGTGSALPTVVYQLNRRTTWNLTEHLSMLESWCLMLN